MRNTYTPHCDKPKPVPARHRKGIILLGVLGFMGPAVGGIYLAFDHNPAKILTPQERCLLDLGDLIQGVSQFFPIGKLKSECQKNPADTDTKLRRILRNAFSPDMSQLQAK